MCSAEVDRWEIQRPFEAVRGFLHDQSTDYTAQSRGAVCLFAQRYMIYV